MKRLILLSALAAILLPAAAYSQDNPPEEVQRQRAAARPREVQMRDREMENRNREMETRNMEMEMRERELGLQQREAEMDFQRKQQETEMDFQRKQQEIELQKRRMELENMHKPKKKDPNPILILVAVVNVLCTVWVYQDIQKRSHESGIWIVITLLTGLLGALVYSVVRIGEVAKQKA